MPVGILEKTTEGKMYFAYLKDAKMAISQSMPLKEKAFDHKNCKAYFGGLIPENQFKSRDVFSFLVHCDQDCVGAISFHDIAAPIVLDNEVHSFSKHIMTTYENEEKLENAYFCLKIAHHAGLTLPKFWIKQHAKQRVLMMERTDRVIEPHAVKRLHQEDFCQALGNKDPSWAELFDLLKVTRVPACAKNYLIKIVIFNVMINNTLAHAGQFALVAKPPNSWEVAPFHHFYCNDNDEASLAMAIGKAKYRRDIQEKDWKIFCEQIHYTFPIFKAIKKEYEARLHKAVLQAQEEVKKEGFNSHLIKKWVRFILS